MKDIALELLNIIYNHGYIAYIVGGMVRDMLLGIESNDVDITTNATPMELKNIFPDALITSETYGAVSLIFKNYKFDITTFRKETDYSDNRHPSEVIYVNDLETDIARRDFTVNAICIDKNNNIVDLIGGRGDVEKRILNTIIDANTSFSLDALRILRAIRFACTLGLSMSDEVISSIKKNKHLLKKLSYNRKKEELDKIFASGKAKEGIELIKKFHLEEDLDLSNLDKIQDYSDIIGIWSMINSSVYPFSSSERDLIKKVNIVYDMNNLDNETLYKYGSYVNILAGINKGLKKKEIIEKYEQLPIKSRDDLQINAQKICQILNKKPGSFLGKILNNLEKKILNNELENCEEKIIEYIKENYNE